MKGKGATYTRIHKPKRIVYIEEYGSIVEAMRREKNIKKLSHHQKKALSRSKRK
jgi:putative endonuclease